MKTDLQTTINSLVKEENEALASAKKRRASIDILGTRKISPKKAYHCYLLLDDSGSMNENNKTSQLKAAYRKLLKELPNMERTELLFSSNIRRATDFETEYGQYGSTVMYDVLIAGTELAKREQYHGNNIIILIGDGEDCGSQSRLEDAIKKIEEGKQLGYQYYAIWINGTGSLGHQAQKLGIPDIDVKNIEKGIDSLIEGIYGYIETGKLALPAPKE